MKSKTRNPKIVILSGFRIEQDKKEWLKSHFNKQGLNMTNGLRNLVIKYIQETKKNERH